MPSTFWVFSTPVKTSDFQVLAKHTFFFLFLKTYYFEEFECLLDELSFRLSALSNSLHHTLPPKAHRCREDSPVSSNISAHVEAQVSWPHHK